MTPDEAFAEHTRLLIALVELDRIGRNKSPVADSVRDLMDYPWYAMTEDDRKLSWELSAALDVAESRRAAREAEQPR